MDSDQPIDTGEPIAELADLVEPAEAGFFGRLWRRIDRRRLGSEIADLGWTGVFTVFIEYLSMLMEVFEAKDERPDLGPATDGGEEQ